MSKNIIYLFLYYIHKYDVKKCSKMSLIICVQNCANIRFLGKLIKREDNFNSWICRIQMILNFKKRNITEIVI